MFGFVRKFVRKLGGTPAESPSSPGDTEIIVEAEPSLPPEPTLPQQTSRVSRPNGAGVELPLRMILSGLPLELQPRVKNATVGDRTIQVPLEKILSQLSRG